MKFVIGVDEAGRGPVIGPMIIVGVALRNNTLDEVLSLGVRDSKILGKRVREKLFYKILELVESYYYVKVEPREIDRENLNKIFYVGVLEVVENLFKELRGGVERVTIDLTGSPKILEQNIRRLGFRGELIIAYKADKRYPEVSTASIVAKVLRDREVEALKRLYGDFGSGYPSDPKTRSWLLEFYEAKKFLPEIVRKSWKTIKDIAPREYVDKKSCKPTRPLIL